MDVSYQKPQNFNLSFSIFHFSLFIFHFSFLTFRAFHFSFLMLLPIFAA